MAYEVIGSVRGHAVRWDRRTGAVDVKFYGFFGGSWERQKMRAFTIQAAFELAEAYLRRR